MRVLTRGMAIYFLQPRSFSAAAHPIGQTIHMTRDNMAHVVLGEHANHRTIVVIFCMAYLFVLAMVQGYRAGRVTRRKTIIFSDVLVFAQGLVSTAFVFAVGINSAGLGLSTDAQCYAAIRVCIAMYGVAKIALYLFLLERVHIVRAPFIDRNRDPVWVIGAIVILAGFAAIMGYEFIAPMAELSRVDGICRIGVHPDAAIAVITLDTAINVGLTSIFVWQLRPFLGSIVLWPSSRVLNGSSNPAKRSFWGLISRKTDKQERTPTQATSQRGLKAMLIRNVVGSSLLLCSTIANNAIFLIWPFATHSHACQLMCLTDVVLGMLVTNWLTIRSMISSTTDSRQSVGTSGMANSTIYRPELELDKQISGIGKTCVSKPFPATNRICDLK